MRHIPNLLSASRVPLSIAAVYFRWAGYGPWAFTLLAVAVFTDMIDGYVARQLKAETMIGKKFIDPFCDGFMTMTSGFGLALGPTGMAWTTYAGLGLGAIAIVMKRLKHDKSRPRLQFFCNKNLPKIYLMTITAIMIAYGYDVSQDDSWIWPTVVLGALAARYIKHQRMADWNEGRM